MKKVRNKVFETNSSSSHSLVISKESIIIDKDSSDYEIADKYFGDCYDLFYAIDTSWDWREYKNDYNKALKEIKKEDPKGYTWIFYPELNEKFEFDFSRGKPRIYDDFIHKTAFILAVNRYREDDELNPFIEKVTEKAEEHLKECNNYDRANALTEIFLKWLFKNEEFINETLTSECSNYNNILSDILRDDDLIEKFIFNSKSYIALGGDEYLGSYLKLVGSTHEYYDRYGSSNYMIEYEKRLKEIYPEDKYNVYIEL